MPWLCLPLAILLLVGGARVAAAQASRSAADYTRRAMAHFDKGDLDGAIADLDIAIAFDPNNAAAFCNRGRAQHNKGNLEGAIADYSGAIALDPRPRRGIQQPLRCTPIERRPRWSYSGLQ